MLLYRIHCGPGGSVDTATSYSPGLNPGGMRFSACPDQPWDTPSLLCNGYWVCPGGKEWSGRAADHSPHPTAPVMEEYSYTATHPLGHTGLVTGSLYLYLFI